MRTSLHRTIGLALAGLALAATAQAQHQGHGQGAGVPQRQGDHSGSVQQHPGNHSGSAQQHPGEHPAGAQQHPGDHSEVRATHGGNGDGPPGLAGKPGQMPPGQYRKQYEPAQGASVLGDIMRQRGYTVTRIVQTGSVQNVYYRTATGTEQLAMVGPGSYRLQFRNVPAPLLEEVLARLY